jgi:2-oxoglutarate ferredoxin oxidoreductase subunit gamma
MRKEIMFAGFGGQGVITAGYITGQAAAVYDDKESSLTRVYGPEARGSACYSGVVVDEEEVDYPYLLNPEIMVIMSQEAYETFLFQLRDGGILVIDSSIVNADERVEKYKVCRVPATQIAEEMGARVVANVVMLGFIGKIWNGVSVKGLRESVKATVPKRHLDLNLKAFERGIQLAEETLKEGALEA